MLRRPDTSDFKPLHRPRPKRTVRTLLSADQLNQAMSRESIRVDRKGNGTLCFVLLRIPGSRRDRESAVRLARIILSRIRITDDVGWFDADHVGLLLPETTPAGAWTLAQEVCDSFANHGPRPLSTMYTYSADAQAAPEPAVLRAASTEIDESGLAAQAAS